MKRIAVAVLATAAMGAVQAEESANRWSGESELGYIWKSGNTKSESLNAKQKLVFDAKPWVNTLTLEASNTSVTNKTTRAKERSGERYFAGDQLDYFFAERTYAFGRATWEKDRFSGFDYRGTWVLGVGHDFVQNETLTLKGEVGAGESHDKITHKPDPDPAKNVIGDKTREAMAYLAESLVWNISGNAEIGQSLRVEYTDLNTYSRFDAYVKSTLVGNVAMKVAYSLRYNTDVPSTARHKDEEVTVSLAYSF